MKFLVILGFLLASLLLEARGLRIKAHFPPKSAKRPSRLVLSGTLPTLREVTICHWINLHGYSAKGMYILSYAHGDIASNELSTGIEHVPRKPGYFEEHTKLMLAIGNNVTVIGSVYANNINFRFLGKWRHLCFTWSSGGGLAEAYLDGTLVANPSTPLQSGQEIRAGGVLMIGQEQDSLDGGFDPDQAWDGYISEVHIWDEKLTTKQIAALSQCDGKLEGNVFAWMRSPLRAEDGVTLSGTNLCEHWTRETP